MRPGTMRLATGNDSIRKRSARRISAKALPWNWRLSRNSSRVRPLNLATFSSSCGKSGNGTSSAQNSTTAARETRSPSTSRPSPRRISSGSRVPGSSTRPRRMDSSSVSTSSRRSSRLTSQPEAGRFSQRSVACISSSSRRWKVSRGMVRVVFSTRS
ncbi:MAG: hypothetical protein IOMNBAOH_00387 [Rhodocyclaceae bacterium]|nr:hypothetical protein [Rhodocyclaceae bacterium]